MVKQIPPSLIDGKTYFADEEGNIITRSGYKRKILYYPHCDHHRGGSKYPYVTIAGRSLDVHRLICAAFWGVPSPNQICHHLDGNKHNNRPSNLIWLNPDEHSKFDRMVRDGQIFIHLNPDRLMACKE